MTTSTLINPATEEELRTVELLDVPATDDAIARAKSAQKQWAKLAPAERAAALRSFAAVVDAHVDELAALEVANSGHVIGNAEWEAGHVRDVLQFYSASPERMSGKQIPVAGGLDVTFNEPLGVNFGPGTFSQQGHRAQRKDPDGRQVERLLAVGKARFELLQQR